MRPAKADYCSGAAVGRSGDAFGDHEGESIEKPTVLLDFFEGRTERAGGLGAGGLGAGGAGAYRPCHSSRSVVSGTLRLRPCRLWPGQRAVGPQPNTLGRG